MMLCRGSGQDLLRLSAVLLGRRFHGATAAAAAASSKSAAEAPAAAAAPKLINSTRLFSTSPQLRLSSSSEDAEDQRAYEAASSAAAHRQQVFGEGRRQQRRRAQRSGGRARHAAGKETPTLPPDFDPADTDLAREIKDSSIGATAASSGCYDDVETADGGRRVGWPTDSTKPAFCRAKQGPSPLPRDDSENSVLLFPGQGAQFVGMGQDCLDVPIVQDLYARASHILDYDLLKLCLHGPADKLSRTVFCQAAVFVTSLAAVEKLFHLEPSAVKNCVGAAGFSVGEITALVFSGAMDFDAGVRLIQVRGESMERAGELAGAPTGMSAVFFGAQSRLGPACTVAKQWVRENHGVQAPVCQVANYLYAGAKVIAGHQLCLDFIDANKHDFGLRKVRRLPVSGAFHTPIMEPARAPLADALQQTKLCVPRIPVYSNLDCSVYKSAQDIRRLLPKQMVRPVKWEQSVNSIFRYESSDHLPRVFECGPGAALTGMLKKINGKVADNATVVTV